MGTKTKPGPYDCYAKAEPDEPIFVLRAKDPIAARLVRLWVALGAEHHDLSKVVSALETADAMDQWRERYEQEQAEANKIIGEWVTPPLSADDPPGPPEPLAPRWPSPEPRCTGCGLNLSGAVMYVCSRTDCPAGLGPTMMNASNKPGMPG